MEVAAGVAREGFRGRGGLCWALKGACGSLP